MEEKITLPNGEEVIFTPEDHKYYVRGREVPSVTSLLSSEFGNKYAFVNPDLLKRSAEYGTAVHDEIAQLIEIRKEAGITINAVESSKYIEVQNYFNYVEPIYEIEPVLNEKVVVLYNDHGDPIAAGRFDMLCTVKGKTTLVDFKTTSTIHKQSVTAQLNLYLRAAQQSGYINSVDDVDLGVIHLSGCSCKYNQIMKLNDTFLVRFMI